MLSIMVKCALISHAHCVYFINGDYLIDVSLVTILVVTSKMPIYKIVLSKYLTMNVLCSRFPYMASITLSDIVCRMRNNCDACCMSMLHYTFRVHPPLPPPPSPLPPRPSTSVYIHVA